ncbi:MAG: hypothetical protein ABW076_04895 [Candidatus Thiodiazotropha sp.]
MKQIIRWPVSILLLGSLSGSPVWAEGEAAGSSTEPPSNTRTYTTRSETQLSRKCGIYSGICNMYKRVEVGAYCVCQTPSGPIYGVVVP